MLVYTFHLSYKEKEIGGSSWSPTKLPMIIINAHKRKKDTRQVGIEPTTDCLEGSCSIR